MKQRATCISVDGHPVTVTGVNLIARFVRIARTTKEANLHLHEKGLFKEMEHLAGNTADVRLIQLYLKIRSELNNGH